MKSSLFSDLIAWNDQRASVWTGDWWNINRERKWVQVGVFFCCFFFLLCSQLRSFHPSIFHRRRCRWAGTAWSVCHCWVLLFAQAVCGWGFIYGETPRLGHHSNIWTFCAHISPWEQRQPKSIGPDSISLRNPHMHLEVESHSNKEKIFADPSCIFLGGFCSVWPADYRWGSLHIQLWK